MNLTDKLIDLADKLDLLDNKVEADLVDGLIKDAAEEQVCGVPGCGDPAIPGILVEHGSGFIRVCPKHLQEKTDAFQAELASKLSG